jgi:hypothetical protein
VTTAILPLSPRSTRVYPCSGADDDVSNARWRGTAPASVI